MIFNQKWQGAQVLNSKCGEFFPATVPGNIQSDYMKANNLGDINYAENCKELEKIEDCGWLYRTTLDFQKDADEKVYFVTHGIEYEYDIYLDSQHILHHEGMFSKVEADITDMAKNGSVLSVYIYPHPKREGADVCRDQADQCCKPAVEYGWDWHPRALVSGIWNDTYIEVKKDTDISECEVLYELDDDLKGATVNADIKCNGSVKFYLYDPDGQIVYEGENHSFRVENVQLWWCNGQGDAKLYKWRAVSETDEKTGYIGFKKVQLIMNGGAWEKPECFPKSRSNPPMTIELNGRRIFAKGTNWVNPEIFTGTITKERYDQQLTLVKGANMNILRCWGGAVINKDCFYETCDRLGIMVWQEFPLACNNYVGTDSYLRVLEQEAKAIIKRLRSHACLVLWCGGNELFNNWSKMTDQSYALRLLNMLCYQYNRDIPFIMTAPVMGMGHGHYVFWDLNEKKSVYEIFHSADCTAYSEFGMPAIAEIDILKEIIPAEKLRTLPGPGTVWETRKGYGVWDAAGKDAWMCFETIDEVFGKQESLEDYVEKSIWIQCEGLKCIFEEARRQSPACSMALNWCFNEPWNNAAGEAIIAYPNKPKKAYYSVKNSLKPVVPSARISKFNHYPKDILEAELWLLNDSPESVSDTVEVYLEIDGEKKHIITWNTGIVEANTNKKGHMLQIEMPDCKQQAITLYLKAKCGENSYTLRLCEKEEVKVNAHALNI